jgi:predicted DNA-binding transcriptional regulator YafY
MKESMPTPASRLITLIMLLQNRPNQKAADLANTLGVSVRTLHRYFGMLDEMGIPVFSERGPYGGFSLVRGYKLPPLVFTPEEAAAVSLGTGLVEEMWGELYREAARSALAKLENLLPEAQRQEVNWARRSLVSAGLHRSDLQALSPTLETLRQAARRRQRVKMEYQGRSRSDAEVREVDPYALVHRWGWWYVVGFCHTRQAMRTFRVDRIAGLTVLDQTFEPDNNFDIQAYLAQETVSQPTFSVRIRFSPAMAPVARESRIGWERLEEQTDGSIIVTMLAPDVVWAASMVMAYGPGVTVLEPESVRQAAREWARSILENYS